MAFTVFKGLKAPGFIAGAPNVDAGDRLVAVAILTPSATAGQLADIISGKAAAAMISSYALEGGVIAQIATQDLSAALIFADVIKPSAQPAAISAGALAP